MLQTQKDKEEVLLKVHADLRNLMSGSMKV